MPSSQIQGTKPGLLRQLGFFSATALVISNMVGSQIFASTGFMAGDLGSASLILICWGVGALFAIAGALSYSELGVNFPSSGGEYVYLTHAFGPEWGFMTGWVSFFAGFSPPLAAPPIAAFPILNCFGIGRITRIQTVLTSTKLIVVIGFVVLGLAVGTGDWSHF